MFRVLVWTIPAWILLACGGSTRLPPDAGEPTTDAATDATVGDDAEVDAGPACHTLFDAREPRRLPADVLVESMVATDVDGDEDIDLVTTGRVGEFSGAIVFLANDGDGSFGETGRFETSFGLGPVAMADIDGDDDPDAVAIDCDTSGIAVARQDEGALVDGHEVRLGRYMGCALAVGDVDGDGAVDVLVPGGLGLVMLRGRGDGQFDQPLDVEGPGYVLQLAAGDLDVDGRAEIVSTSAGNLSVYEDEGAGVTESSILQGTGDVVGFAVADLEGDGDLDVASWTSASTIVYRNDGLGALLAEDAPEIRAMETRSLADVDGVGELDWVGPYYDGILIVPGEGGVRPPELVHWDPNGSRVVFALGDLDQDGDTDVAFGYSEIEVVLGEAGDFPHRGAPVRRPDSEQEANPEALAIGDLDGDGGAEVAVTHEFGLSLFRLRDVVPSAWSELGPFGERVEAVVALDLEPDGDLDLACVAEDPDLAGTAFYLFENDGAGNFARIASDVRDRPFEAAASGDLDADGDPDLALAANDGTVTIAWNLGDAVVDLSDPLPVGVGAESVVIADLNGDGSADIATANDFDDTVSLLWGPRFGEADAVPIAGQPEALAAGDLDGDGNVDLVVVHGTDVGPIDLVSVLLNDGAGGFGATTFQAPGQPRGVALGDADLDGDLDVAVASANFWVWLFPNDGAGTLGAPTAIRVGRGAFALAFADIDHDCGPDLVVADKFSSDVTVVLAHDP